MASDTRTKELNLSEDEVKRITEAFKKEEFRKLFAEYAEEIADPDNRKRYEAEIAQMEAERGMNVKFIQPLPGHVIKTTIDGDTKAFINICKNEHIEKPSSNKQKTADGRSGLQWSIPHSFALPRDDSDKGGNKCRVFDVVFHPDTYRMGETNARFRGMLHETALDGIERQFQLTLDRKNLRFPKMKFKGIPSATVIRTRSGQEPKTKDQDDIMNSFPYPYDNKTSEEKAREHEEKVKKNKEKRNTAEESASDDKENDPYTRPKYNIKYRDEIELDQFRNAPDAKPSTRPKELVVEIDLPLLKSAAQVDLDIFEKQLVLKSEEPAKYKLDLNLPYPVDDNTGSAKFDKSKKKLIVTLSVLADTTIHDFFQEIHSVGKLSDDVSKPEPGFSSEGKPLIEVLSSTESNNKAESQNQECQVSEQEMEEQVLLEQKKNDVNKDIWRTEEESMSGKMSCIMPEFDYDQDLGTVSLVLRVKNVDKDSVVKTFPFGDQKQIQVKFVSVGSGLCPLYYSLFLRFEEGCNIIPEACSVDVSADNLVLVLAKAKLSWSWWDKFEAGVDENGLEGKYFITEKSLKVELDELGAAPVMPAEQEASPELFVSEMNTDHVTVEIKEKEDAPVASSPESDIEIVHDKAPVRLHSILKQRSRTTSESSDEVFPASYSRENSISESPISEGDEENCGAGRKKSVSFSEQVDTASYKSNSTISALHNTLKNKRRRARKREEKKAQGKGGRRRRTSSGGSYSSDDHSSAGQPEDCDLGDNDLDPHVIKASTKYAQAKENKADTGIKTGHTPPETKRTQKQDPTEADVTKDLKGVEEQKVDGSAESGDIELQSRKAPATPNATSITNDVNAKEVFRDCKLPLSGGDVASNDKAPGGNGKKKSKNKKKNRNKHKTTANLSQSEDEQAAEDEAADENKTPEGENGEPGTLLSWEGAQLPAGGNEHRTQCAFQFANSLVYDLDEE